VTYSAGGGGGYSGATQSNGAANTGNGGAYSGRGGSGIVIIRYADTFPAAASASVSPTTTGGYRIYTFTANGSITF
jgi:hypothetical protein